MLFNSFEFIFLFLPATLLVYYGVARFGAAAQVKTLALASLVFYCGWDVRYLPLLLGSIVGNFMVGRAVARHASASPARARTILTAGVAANLALLVYYKYSNFFASSANAGFDTSLPLMDIVLPLGISFFTFTQIAFLVDTLRGKADEPDFVQYLAFVTYFPHLIAGPILHHHETIPQFRRGVQARSVWFAPGLAMFALGLAKKTLIADPFGAIARPVFEGFARGDALSGADAWLGSLAYTFQLYFDFSAYCDMAVGISLMLGIYIPLNFDSPYKATSIIDFWRRWHMTLSRYLRDYLYIALGGSRRGRVRRYVNLLLTMVLGGLWHGAGWTFLAWGALHGGYLVVNHAWRALRPAGDTHPSWIGAQAARLLTFLCVVVAWVFFRADSVATATGMLVTMAGLPGQLSPGIATAIGALLIPPAVSDAGFAVSPAAAAACALAAGFVLVWGFRNTQEMVFRELPWSRPLETAPAPEGWRVHWAMVPLTGVALLCGLLALIAAPPGEFLYFNF